MTCITPTALDELIDPDNRVAYKRRDDGMLTVITPEICFTVEPRIALYFWRVLLAEALSNVGLPRDADRLEITRYLDEMKNPAD